MFGKKIRSRSLLDETIFIGKALDIGFSAPTIHPFSSKEDFLHASQLDSYGVSLFDYRYSEETIKKRRNSLATEFVPQLDYQTVSQSGHVVQHGSHHMYSIYGKVLSGVSLLDHDINIWDVKCLGQTQLVVDFANGHSTARRLIPGSRLVIGKKWDCYGQDTNSMYGDENVRAFMVIAREIELSEENMLRVKFYVKKITAGDLFYELKVDYHSTPLVRNMVDSNGIVSISPPSNKRYSTSYRLYNYGLNYDIPQQKVKNPAIELYKYGNFTVECNDCFATINAELKVEIDVGFFSINSAKILIGGHTVANATLLFSYKAQYTKEKEGTLFTYSSIPISLFYIFTINVTPSLEYKFKIEANGKIEYQRNFLVTYSKYFGYKYDSKNGFQSVTEGDGLSFSSKSPGIYLEGETIAELALYPKFKLELFDWLPSAEVSVIPTVKGVVRAEGTITRTQAALFVKFDAFYKLEVSLEVKDKISELFEVIGYTAVPSISGSYSLQTSFYSATESNSTISSNNPIPVNYKNETITTGATVNTIDFDSTPKNPILISKKTVFRHSRNVLNKFSFISFSVKFNKIQLKTPLSNFNEYYDSSNSKYVYSAFTNSTDFTLDPSSQFTIQFEQVFAYQPLENSETLTYPRQAISETSTMVTFLQKVSKNVPKYGIVMDAYGTFDAYVYEGWFEKGRFVQSAGRKYEETYPTIFVLGTYFYSLTMENNFNSDHYVIVQLTPNDPDFPLELNSIRFDPYYEFSPSDSSIVKDNLNRLVGLQFGSKQVVYPYIFVQPINNEINVKLYTDYEIYRAFYMKPKAGVGLSYTLSSSGTFIPMLKDNQYGTEVGISTSKPVSVSVFPNYKLLNGIPSNAKTLTSQDQTYFAFDCRTFYDSVTLNSDVKVFLRVIDSSTGFMTVNDVELEIRMVTNDGYVYSSISKRIENNMFVFEQTGISSIKANCGQFDRIVQIRLKNLQATTRTFQLEVSLVYVSKSNDLISVSVYPTNFGQSFKDISAILTKEKNSGKSGIVLKYTIPSYLKMKTYLSANARNVPPSFSDPQSIMSTSNRILEIGTGNAVERLPISFNSTNQGTFLFVYAETLVQTSVYFYVEDLPNTFVSLSFENGKTKIDSLSNSNTTLVYVTIDSIDHYWVQTLQKTLQQDDQYAFLLLKAQNQYGTSINLRNIFSRIMSFCNDRQLILEMVPIQNVVMPTKLTLSFESTNTMYSSNYNIPVLNVLQVDSGENNNPSIPPVLIICPERCVECDATNTSCIVCKDGYFGRNCSETCLETCKTCTNGSSCETCSFPKYGNTCTLENNGNSCPESVTTPLVSVSSSSGGSLLTYTIKISKQLLSGTNETRFSHLNVDSCARNSLTLHFQTDSQSDCFIQYSYSTSIANLMNESRVAKQIDSSGTVLTLSVPLYTALITFKSDSYDGEYCEIVNYGVNHNIKVVLSSHQVIGMNVNGNVSNSDDDIPISYRREIISVQDGFFSLTGKLFTTNATVLSVNYVNSVPFHNIEFDIFISEYRKDAYNIIMTSKQKISYISGVFNFAIQVQHKDKIVQLLLSISISYTIPIDPSPTELQYSTQVNMYSENFNQHKNMFTISDTPHVLVNILDSNGKSSSLPSSISLSIKNAYMCCTKSGVSMPTYDPSKDSYGCAQFNSTTMTRWFHLVNNQIVSSQYGTSLIKFPLINFQVGFKFTIQSFMFPKNDQEALQISTCFIHTESVLTNSSPSRLVGQSNNIADETTSIHNAFDIMQVFSAEKNGPVVQPSASIVSTPDDSDRLNDSSKNVQSLSLLLISILLVVLLIQ